MNIVKIVCELCVVVVCVCSEGKCIGFVLIMGNFYVGYVVLVKKVGECVDFVVVSIFVNLL